MANLIVTIDTEEEGLWGGEYRRTGNTVENIRGVPRFQQLCDNFGVRPTYLIDAPVVESDDAVRILRGIHDDCRCEIGAHVHPWCNPPFEEEINERNTYLCNLPELLQQRKIAWLTEAIESRFGRLPTSFRAGRYGMGAAGARVLADKGYLVDSSVLPFINYAPIGPDYRNAPYQPYRISRDDLCKAEPDGDLLELPICVGYSRTNFENADRIKQLAMKPWLRRLRVSGIADRIGLARRIKLCPEQGDVARMKQLISACLRQGQQTLVFMFHSSSLLVGGSGYVSDEAALEEIYRRIEGCFQFAFCEVGMQSATLSDVAVAIDEHLQLQLPHATNSLA